MNSSRQSTQNKVMEGAGKRDLPFSTESREDSVLQLRGQQTRRPKCEGPVAQRREELCSLWAVGSLGEFCAERGAGLYSVLDCPLPVLSLTHPSPSQAPVLASTLPAGLRVQLL